MSAWTIFSAWCRRVVGMRSLICAESRDTSARDSDSVMVVSRAARRSATTSIRCTHAVAASGSSGGSPSFR